MTCCYSDECNKDRFISGTSHVETTTLPVSVTKPIQVTAMTFPVFLTGTSQVINTAPPVPITANSKNYFKCCEYMIFSLHRK